MIAYPSYQVCSRDDSVSKNVDYGKVAAGMFTQLHWPSPSQAPQLNTTRSRSMFTKLH